MTKESATGPVRRSVTLSVSRDRAFAVFADEMGRWWPRENTFAKDAFAGVTVEPGAGGRWIERDAGGGEAEWGRVLVWEPPRRLVLTWQIAPDGTPEPDPARASEVEIGFVAVGASTTRVELERRAFERHGEPGGTVWRNAMSSGEGWDKILARCAAETAP